MEDLEALPLADQDRWLLLHGSLQQRVAHLPWGFQWMHVEAAMQRAERQGVDSAFAILGLLRVDGPVTAQITLPLRHGGLALSRTSPGEGSAVYVAAAATTHQAMLYGPEAFWPFDGPNGVQLRTKWASLHCRAGALWPPEYQEVSPDSLETIAAAQRKFLRQAAQTRADALWNPSTRTRQKGRAHEPACSTARAAQPRHGWTHFPSPRLSNS
jgi:hypothetical protein